MTAVLQYIRQHKLTDYAVLSFSTETAVDCFHKLGEELRDNEAVLIETTKIMGIRWTM